MNINPITEAEVERVAAEIYNLHPHHEGNPFATRTKVPFERISDKGRYLQLARWHLASQPPPVGNQEVEAAKEWFNGSMPQEPNEHWKSVQTILTALHQANARIVELEDALAFYANPETYHAISFLSDPPCGDFMDDFDCEHGDPNYNSKPGKLARETLAAMSADLSKAGEKKI